MNFYRFLEQIQKGPDRQKRRFLAVAVGLSAVVLLVVWFLKLKNDIAGQPGLFSLEPARQEKSVKTSGETKTESPLASLGRGLSLFVADLKEKSQELLSQTSQIAPAETPSPGRPVYKLPNH